MQTAQQPSESGSKPNHVRCSLSWVDDDQHLIERGLRKVLCLLTCYIDFPEQLCLYKAQEVNDGSSVDDKGDPLTGMVQECHISDVPLQDFHLCLALESCKGSRQQSKRPAGHRKLSSDRSGEGLRRCWSCSWVLLTAQEQKQYFKAGKTEGVFQWLYSQVLTTVLYRSMLLYLPYVCSQNLTCFLLVCFLNEISPLLSRAWSFLQVWHQSVLNFRGRSFSYVCSGDWLLIKVLIQVPNSQALHAHIFRWWMCTQSCVHT